MAAMAERTARVRIWVGLISEEELRGDKMVKQSAFGWSEREQTDRAARVGFLAGDSDSIWCFRTATTEMIAARARVKHRTKTTMSNRLCFLRRVDEEEE
nr:hypothetical protein Itr_chr01CG24550 [Ipomoea trifida]GMC54491.1 hypothetical protein Iba_chr01dCG16560 [Ipomoea batatas]